MTNALDALTKKPNEIIMTVISKKEMVLADLWKFREKIEEAVK